MKRLLGCTLVLVLVCMGTVVAFAQSESARMSGRVTDPTGALIPGAEVIVTNIDTNLSFTSETNEYGLYAVPSLKAGKYRVTIRKVGFEQVVTTGVVLHVQDSLTQNFTLPVGSVSTSITVTADEVTLQTTPEVSTVIGSKFLENMPLNGRTLQALIALTPGVLTANQGGFGGNNAGQISVNGLRTTANYFTIDGVSANIGVPTSTSAMGYMNGSGLPGFSALGTTNNLVSVDALQEFKIQTSNFAAEFGRTPGGQVQLITKSGTNEWHGSAFEYLRNNALDARDWFVNAKNLFNPPLRQNDFGGTLGGPIVKNRTFFFFSFEDMIMRLPQVVSTNVVSNTVRAQAPAVLKTFLAAQPLPNGAENTAQGTAVFNGAYSDPSNLKAMSVRVDHTLNSKIALFGRYNYSPATSTSHGLAIGFDQKTTTQTLTTGATINFSPRVSNELRFNWSHNRGGTFQYMDSIMGATPPSIDAWAAVAPGVNLDTSRVQISFNASYAARGPQADSLNRQINITDNLSWARGAHLLKFGADVRYVLPTFAPATYAVGYGFGTAASIISGNPTFVSVSYTAAANQTSKNIGFFAQDNWKAMQRLTLDFGLRWDINPSPHIDPAIRLLTGVDNLATMSVGPLTNSFFPTIWTQFGPRIGAAYQLRSASGWETVLRGGYGLFQDVPGAAWSITTSFYPNAAQAYNYPPAVAFPLTPAMLQLPTNTSTPPFPASGVYTGLTPDFAAPRTHQWNFGIQQMIARNQTLTATYVGNAARRLVRRSYVASTNSFANPNFVAGFGSFLLVDSSANGSDSSDYNALQVQFERHTSRMQALVNYSWAHSIDTNSNDIGFVGVDSSRYNPRTDRASSDYDRRHVLNVALSYDLPALSFSGAAGAMAKAVTRDWSLEGRFTYQSAYPILIYISNVAANIPGNNLGPYMRPDVVAGVPVWIADATVPGGKRLNPNAFAIPSPSTRQGNMARNQMRGLAVWQPDLAIRRQFSMTDRVKLQIKAEMFNAVNHPNFGAPYAILGSLQATGVFIKNAAFGTSTTMLNRVPSSYGGALSPLFQAGGPREIQLNMKITF